MDDKAYLTVRVRYRKTDIPLDEICYICIEDRKTKITMFDGTVYLTNKKVKEIFAVLPEKVFENINRGIIVALKYVRSIENGIYTMSDGAQFKRRVRSDRVPKKHKVINMVNLDAEKASAEKLGIDSYLMADKMPIAFCVIEFVFNADGSGIDFIFRYCNPEMEKLKSIPLSKMYGKSFCSIFKEAEKKWLVTYLDVALNGISKIIEGYSAEFEKNLRIYCFQPKQGFCACMLVDMA